MGQTSIQCKVALYPNDPPLDFIGQISTQDRLTLSAYVMVPVILLVGQADLQLEPVPDTQPDKQVPLYK